MPALSPVTGLDEAHDAVQMQGRRGDGQGKGRIPDVPIMTDTPGFATLRGLGSERESGQPYDWREVTHGGT